MTTPLFDSLTHPTLSGKWLNSCKKANFDKLTEEMYSSNVVKACAVGLSGVEGYEHEYFANECKKYESLIPIAGISPHVDDINYEIKKIKSFGFKGVKLHPRFGNFNLSDQKNELIKIFKVCKKNDLVVFLCTYLSCSIERFPMIDPYWELVEIVKKSPETKVVLLHGGTSRLMEYADLVRFNPNLLLDLSYSIIKYEGSSMDLDIQYLFKTFDQKICIGSDHPEFTFEKLRERAEYFSREISVDKKENIYYKNLMNFLEVKL
jgi:predicted TIM-barrel fold metal-dependent hydrolase